jgi:YfiH family protein
MPSADWISPDWPAPGNVAAGTSTRAASLDELPATPRWLKQVHGATVIHSQDPAFAAGPPEADAVISTQANDILAVRTADCLPVLLCSRAGDEIAAVHCGWRSLAADILAQTTGKMQAPSGELLAWLGPAISQDAFEVQDDVRDAFVSQDEQAAACFLANERGRWQADLYELARRKLAQSGVSHVFGGGLCTYADPQRFYSYRRDGDTGRMVTFIVRR